MTSYKQKIRTDYKICPLCGASLDPGEKCDCEAVEVFILTAADVLRATSKNRPRRRAQNAPETKKAYIYQ